MEPASDSSSFSLSLVKVEFLPVKVSKWNTIYRLLSIFLLDRWWSNNCNVLFVSHGSFSFQGKWYVKTCECHSRIILTHFLVSFSLWALSSLQGWPQQRCRYLKPWSEESEKATPPPNKPSPKIDGGITPLLFLSCLFTTLPEGIPSYTEVWTVRCLRLSTPVCPEEAGSQTPVMVSTWLRAFIKLAGMCTNRNGFNWIQIHREA